MSGVARCLCLRCRAAIFDGTGIYWFERFGGATTDYAPSVGELCEDCDRRLAPGSPELQNFANDRAALSKVEPGTSFYYGKRRKVEMWKDLMKVACYL